MRNAKLLTLVFLLAVLAVGFGAWRGWSGERTSEVVYLRPLGAVEAALLLEAGKAWIPEVDRDAAVIVTNQQLFPARDSDPPELVLSSGTRRLWPEPIAAGRAFVRHRVGLRALEHALDDPNVGQFVERRAEVDAHGRGTPIYASYLILLYALFELSLLVAFGSGILAAVVLPRRRILIAPGIAGVCLFFLLAVQLYEPAFLAHDFLRHRIVVDRIAVIVLAISPAAVVLAILCLAAKLGQLVTRASGKRAQRLAALVAVLGLLGAGVAAWSWTAIRHDAELERVAENVAALAIPPPPAIELLMLGRHARRSDHAERGEIVSIAALPEPSRRYFAALDAARQEASPRARLAVALARGAVAELGGPEVPDGSIKIAANGGVEKELASLLERGEASRTGFGVFVTRFFMRGELVQSVGRSLAPATGDGEPVVAAMVEQRSGLARALSEL